jgi:tRNA 5-methylaminomethyl-2-thiouridine biosynthesis bifunctional protein
MPAPPSSSLEFDENGVPRSRRYDDVYFSREGGLAEARTVFLAGCGLPERWHGRRSFTVAELGFGTGLNIAALLDLWARTRPTGGRLHVFSVEAEPLGAGEARRALALWPELAPVTELMLARWPGRAAGFHRLDLPELGASLDLAVMDAEAAVEAWSGRADAWFLDGFSPAKNPGMWTEALIGLVAARSAPGARAATYTVAGAVRRALASAGFAVERRPGFGGKRERLEAFAPGELGAETATPRVAVVGGGIAGAALARAFEALGARASLFEASTPGAGGSGNPAALVTPRLDAGLGDVARLHAQAFGRAVGLYESLDGAAIARGVLQFETQPRDHERFAKISASDLFEPGALVLLDAGEVSAAVGEPAPPALHLARALVIDPGVALATWTRDWTPAAVAGLERGADSWRLVGPQGETLAEAEVVCLATGADLAALWPEAQILPVRGQLSRALGVTAPPAAWGAYVAPSRDGAVFGATHDRADTSLELRDVDDARNLAAVSQALPGLAGRLAGAMTVGRVAIRATTPDRMPLAGQLAPGLFVLGGFGSRGFALAPLLAEHVAALALCAPSPLPQPLVAIVAPERFRRRAERRSGVAAARGLR